MNIGQSGVGGAETDGFASVPLTRDVFIPWWTLIIGKGHGERDAAQHVTAGKAVCVACHAWPPSIKKMLTAWKMANRISSALLLVGLGLGRQRPAQLCQGCKPPVPRAWLVSPQRGGGGRWGGLCAWGPSGCWCLSWATTGLLDTAGTCLHQGARRHSQVWVLTQGRLCLR